MKDTKEFKADSRIFKRVMLLLLAQANNNRAAQAAKRNGDDLACCFENGKKERIKEEIDFLKTLMNKEH